MTIVSVPVVVNFHAYKVNKDEFSYFHIEKSEK